MWDTGRSRSGVNYSLSGFVRKFKLEPEDIIGRYTIVKTNRGFTIVYMSRLRKDYVSIQRVKKSVLIPLEEFEGWEVVRKENYSSMSCSRFIRLAVNRWKEDYFPEGGLK